MATPWFEPHRVVATLPDKHDHRDFKKTFSEQEIYSTASQASVDLRPYVRLVYCQGKLGSCTVNALCSAYSMDLAKQPESVWFNPSRLFLYFNCRRKEGHQSAGPDTGVSIRDGIKMLNKYGVCKEELWPYKFWQTNYTVEPSQQCYEGAKGTGCRYERLLDHNSTRERKTIKKDTDFETNIKDIGPLKACLFQGSPFVFQFKIYQQNRWPEEWVMPYRPPEGWVMPYPSFNKKDFKGWHAVMAVGYNDHHPPHHGGCVTILNSWGATWGDHGYFYMPYHIITNPDICGDFWKISYAIEPKDQY